MSDDEHADGDLAKAAAVYNLAVAAYLAANERKHKFGRRFASAGIAPERWPWPIRWWKPKDRKSDLIRAAALLVAELERRE